MSLHAPGVRRARVQSRRSATWVEEHPQVGAVYGRPRRFGIDQGLLDFVTAYCWNPGAWVGFEDLCRLRELQMIATNAEQNVQSKLHRLVTCKITDSGTAAASASSSTLASLVTAKWWPAVKDTGPDVRGGGTVAGMPGIPNIVIRISLYWSGVYKRRRLARCCDEVWCRLPTGA